MKGQDFLGRHLGVLMVLYLLVFNLLGLGVSWLAYIAILEYDWDMALNGAIVTAIAIPLLYYLVLLTHRLNLLARESDRDPYLPDP